MAFPGAIPSYTGFTPGHTLVADAHASQHNSEQADIIALATKLGTGASTPSAGTVLRGTGSGVSAYGQVALASEVSGILPIANGGTGATTAGAAKTNLGIISLSDVYPIGCIYTEINGINPNTTFGFGTWVQFGQGQVPVGQKAADTNFGTVLATGGAASHTHTLSDAGQAQMYHHDAGGNTFIDSRMVATTSFTSTNRITTAGNLSGVASPSGAALAGSTDSSTFLPPFIVVYMWRRTA